MLLGAVINIHTDHKNILTLGIIRQQIWSDARFVLRVSFDGGKVVDARASAVERGST
jgi:hypothetical protein